MILKIESMILKDDIKNLITNHQRRLQKLKEMQALHGHSVDPKILIEIEDIETRLEELTSISELDVEKAIDVLQQTLPADDPTPQRLRQLLDNFQDFHNRLFEWKELHNYLNDVVFVMDQFAREVERLDARGESGNPRLLARLWRPVTRKVMLLVDWAATVQYIDSPLVSLPDGARQGPRWAIELQVAQTRIDEVFKSDEFDVESLYDATYDFTDVAERHLYLADKQLRDTAGDLYALSRVVLGA